MLLHIRLREPRILIRDALGVEILQLLEAFPPLICAVRLVTDNVGPNLIVALVAFNPAHIVDGRGATEALAAEVGEFAVIKRSLLRGLIKVVEAMGEDIIDAVGGD